MAVLTVICGLNFERKLDGTQVLYTAIDTDV
uniref:Uncharacterized protein MANES_01G115300 n=1 Tax=Rhizophora mucronata TaxID=61149 RepID=A0A2P2KV66_RHIMU